MRGLRAAGNMRANSPKLKNHRLCRWMFILYYSNAIFFRAGAPDAPDGSLFSDFSFVLSKDKSQTRRKKLCFAVHGKLPSVSRRHTRNVPIQTVSKYMGHSDSTVTLKVYSHFIHDTQGIAVNALNRLTE